MQDAHYPSIKIVSMSLWLLLSSAGFLYGQSEQADPLKIRPFPPPTVVEGDQLYNHRRDLQLRAGLLLDTTLLRVLVINERWLGSDSVYQGIRRVDSLTREERGKLQAAWRGLKKEREAVLRTKSEAESIFQSAVAMEAMDSLGLSREIPRLWVRLERLFAVLFPEAAMIETPVANILGPEQITFASLEKPEDDTPMEEDGGKGKALSSGLSPPLIVPYNALLDMYLNPPVIPCVLASEEKDVFSGSLVRRTRYLEVFHYSHAVLEHFLAGRHQVVCAVALQQADDNFSMDLLLTICDPATRKNFGSLPKGGAMHLRWIDGSQQVFINSTGDEGKFDPEEKKTIYRGNYSLDKATVKKMSQSELDSVRISWSAGFEDYDVQQVDVFRQLLRCFGSQ
jgi:hypothetical protein